jgi:uncharacterized protein YdeI (YjbR/CyaY-like superfamily)
LKKNHQKEDAVWLLYYKSESGVPTIGYVEAVVEALCYGWIDSKAQKIDSVSWRQFFSKRKPKSVWSKSNKERIARLLEEGRITEAGFKAIKAAKENGSWDLLTEVEELKIPAA